MMFVSSMQRAIVALLLLGASALAQKHPGLAKRPAGRLLDETAVVRPADTDTLLQLNQRERGPLAATDEELQYFEAAAMGQTWAQTRLAMIYARANNDPQRWQRAVQLLKDAAAKGDPEAFYQLGALSTAGRGVELSQVTAFEHMKRAAELGLAEGQYELASMYAEGRGTAKDMDAALEWGLKAARQGHLQAQFSSGRVMVDSVDPRVRAEGLEWLTKAADANHSEALLTLATAYGKGQFGLTRDEAKAEALLKAGAERGDADCQFVLASLYKFGDSFADRRGLAKQWLERAAASGHQKAIEVLQAEAKSAETPAP